MTNTNDFRRYSYSNDPSYLINQFDFQRSSRTSVAPKYAPETETRSTLKLHENTKRKSKTQLLSEQKKALVKSLKVIGVAVLCLAMIGLVINSFVVKNELTKQIAQQEVNIANAQSENISLQSKLDSLVSISMIDEYAVNQLGMTKVKSNQIQYMDVDEYKVQRQDAVMNQTNEASQQIDATSSNK